MWLRGRTYKQETKILLKEKKKIWDDSIKDIIKTLNKKQEDE